MDQWTIGPSVYLTTTVYTDRRSPLCDGLNADYSSKDSQDLPIFFPDDDSSIEEPAHPRFELLLGVDIPTETINCILYSIIDKKWNLFDECN